MARAGFDGKANQVRRNFVKLLSANEDWGVFPNSYYAATASSASPREKLDGGRKADVCIVGGGFTGLSAALHLAQAGFDVVLLEAHRIGWGASGRNGGQLGTGQRKEQPELEAEFGLPQAKAMWDIATESVELVKNLIETNTIACDLKPGIIHANHRARFDTETALYAEHMREIYGHPITYLSPSELREEVKSPRYSGGTYDPVAAHLHPLKFAQGLAEAAEAAGARFYELSEVIAIDQGPHARTKVKTRSGDVNARHVLLACNGYLNDLEPSIGAKVMPINNFIIATEPLDAEIASGILANDYAVADSKFVVNYFRFSDDKRLLFGGGESYGYRFPKDIKGFVRRAMVDIFPQTKDLRIDYGWGGTLAITMNRLPHLKRVTSSTYSASGYSGHGVGMATMSGKIIADAIAGDASKFDVMAAIQAKDFPGRGAMRQPLLVAAMLWYALRDRL